MRSNRSMLGMVVAAALLTTQCLPPPEQGGQGQSTTPNPNAGPAHKSLEGVWRIEYSPNLEVDINIGGTTYRKTVGANGGKITVNHRGKPYTFDLDCSRKDIVCPNEAWDKTFRIHHHKPNDWRHFEIRNERTGERRGGMLQNNGNRFAILLGAGVTGAKGCGLLAHSSARGGVIYPPGSNSAVRLINAEVYVSLAGACLFGNDNGGAGAALGATLKVTNRFTAIRSY